MRRPALVNSAARAALYPEGFDEGISSITSAREWPKLSPTYIYSLRCGRRDREISLLEVLYPANWIWESMEISGGGSICSDKPSRTHRRKVILEKINQAKKRSNSGNKQTRRIVSCRSYTNLLCG